MSPYSNVFNDPTSSYYDDTRVLTSTSGSEEEEEYYSDPGHSEEAIYACFESKNFRAICANTVR